MSLTGNRGAFQAWDLFVESWYPVLRAAKLRRGGLRELSFLGRPVVLYRTRTGALGAMKAHCPHIGAPLRVGRVTDRGIRCAMHGWEITPEGYPANALPVCERNGLIWIHHGSQPRFEVPELEVKGRILLPMPTMRLRCHPHAATGNGFDAVHFPVFHGFVHEKPPALTAPDDTALSVALCGRPKGRWMQGLLRATETHPIRASFTSHGGNISVTRVNEPFATEFVLAGLPDVATKESLIFGVLSLPLRPVNALRALLMAWYLLRGDERLLDGIVLGDSFTPSDHGLERFVRFVEALPYAR